MMRYGKTFDFSGKIEGAERWATHYGAMGIFAARLLPVVRHLIGIRPASSAEFLEMTLTL